MNVQTVSGERMGNPLLNIGMDSNRSRFMARQLLKPDQPAAAVRRH